MSRAAGNDGHRGLPHHSQRRLLLTRYAV